MRVANHLVDLVLLAVPVAPDLAVTHEEQLLSCQVQILHRKIILFLVSFTEICFVSSFQTSIVCYILSQSVSINKE